MLDLLINIFILLAVLVVLVVIHEFGHFIVARRAKVKVHEFGIGFPPRAAVLGSDGETTYTLNWLPIGGFVRLEGEEGESDDPRSFVRQSLRTRLIILLAGVVMNILLAFLIFAFIAAVGDPVGMVRIGAVEEGSPAAAAGLRGGQQVGQDERGRPTYDASGDLLVAVDGRRFPVFEQMDVPDSALLRYLRERPGQQVTLTVRDPSGAERQVPVTLRVPGPDQGPLGITARGMEQEDVQNEPLTALRMGAERTVDAATLILRGLQGLIVNITNPPVSGPVGIVGAIGVVRSELPPMFLLWFVGLLSANLAVINALPFPPLDGGRVAVSLIQAVSGNRVSAAAERLVYLTGFVLLMMLIVWITLFDTGILQRQGI